MFWIKVKYHSTTVYETAELAKTGWLLNKRIQLIFGLICTSLQTFSLILVRFVIITFEYHG